MKKLHGIRVVAYAQKRKKRNKEKARIEQSETFLEKLLLGKLYQFYPSHTLFRRY